MATKSGKVLVGTALCLVTDELEDYPRKIELAWRRPPVTHRGDQPTGYLPPRASELKSRTGERYSTGEDLSLADGPVIYGVNVSGGALVWTVDPARQPYSHATLGSIDREQSTVSLRVNEESLLPVFVLVGFILFIGATIGHRPARKPNA